MRDNSRSPAATELESRVRRVLREEADAVPFGLTLADLEARRVARRRRRVSGGLVAAAAVVVLAVSVGAALLTRPDRPAFGGDPTPTGPSVPPGSSSLPPASASLRPAGPGLPPLASPAGRIVLEDGGVPPGGITWLDTGEPQTKVVGRYEPGEYRIQLACEGGGDLSWSLRDDGSFEAQGGAGRCGADLAHSVLGLVTEAPGELTLMVQNGAAWHVILSEFEAGMAVDLSDVQPIIGNVVADHETPALGGLGVVEERIRGIPLSDRYVIQIACFGPAPLEWALGGSVERPGVVSSTESCARGDVSRIESAAPPGLTLPLSMLVRANRSVAWRVMVETGSDLGPIVPPVPIVYVGDLAQPAIPSGCVERWTVGEDSGERACPREDVRIDAGAAINLRTGDAIDVAYPEGWTTTDVSVYGARLDEEGGVGGRDERALHMATVADDGFRALAPEPGDALLEIRGSFSRPGASFTTTWFVFLRVTE